MATVIKPARSYNEDWVPDTTQIEEAEIGVNVPKRKIYMRNTVFEMRPVGGIYDGKNLPREDPAVAGEFWNDDGVLKVSAG